MYYDFPALVDPLNPFLGAGLGYGWVKADLSSSGPNMATSFNGSNSVFAYQVSGGIAYDFAENFGLNILYRYLATERAKELGKSFQAHMANIEIVYRFNESIYK